jgi:hypothetical protein
MKLGYGNRKLEKICTEKKAAIKHLPADISPGLLLQRLGELAAFDNLDEIPFQMAPLHFHPLRANLARKYAVTLRSLWRIVIEPAGDFEQNADGTAVESTVTQVTILCIEDYHPK